MLYQMPNLPYVSFVIPIHGYIPIFLIFYLPLVYMVKMKLIFDCTEKDIYLILI